MPNNDGPEKNFFSGFLPYFLIILTGFLLYFKTLFFDFTYLDDNVLILDNFHFLKNLSNIIQAFRIEVFYILHAPAAYYRPILTISFIIDAQLGGKSPFIYHLTNLLIHLLSSSLFFIFLAKLGFKKPLAFFFALIFTVHPVLTQAVAWIPGRNDSLLAVFIFSSFYYFLKFKETKKLSFYLLHLLFFALALFTKETAIVLIPLSLLYLYLIVEKKLSPLKEKIFLSIGWIIILTLWFPLRQAAMVNPLKMTVFDLFRSLSLNLPAVIPYLGKIIFPVNLSVLPILQDTSFVFGFLSLFLVTLLLSLSKKRRLNFIIFGAAWFIFFLLPSFIRPNPQIVADFIEHRIYLSLAGFFILLREIDFVKEIDFKKKRDFILGLAFIIVFSLITFFYSDNFKNRLNFWKNAASTSPHSPLAHRNLGAIYYLDKKLDLAETEYKKSLELNSQELMVHNNLGLIYMDKGQFDQAEEEYKKELTINPYYDNAHFNLGLLYFKLGKTKEAEKFWQKTIEINPDYFDAYQNLAILYYQQKDIPQAIYYLNQLQKRGISPPADILKILNYN